VGLVEDILADLAVSDTLLLLLLLLLRRGSERRYRETIPSEGERASERARREKKRGMGRGRLSSIIIAEIGA
jgi:hypothetical protein